MAGDMTSDFCNLVALLPGQGIDAAHGRIIPPWQSLIQRDSLQSHDGIATMPTLGRPF